MFVVVLVVDVVLLGRGIVSVLIDLMGTWSWEIRVSGRLDLGITS